MGDSRNELNPYSSSLEPQSGRPDGLPRPLWRTAAAGAIWSVVSVFPITALFALIFRFPVPFGEIEGGPAHVLPSMFALFFYGVLFGGFIVVGTFGSLAGVAAHFLTNSNRQRRVLQCCLSVAVAFILVFVLATLDWYIGHW